MRTLEGEKKEDEEAFRSGSGTRTFGSSSRSAEEIFGSRRTLSRWRFTKGRTERDFLHCSLGELRGH